MWPGKRQKTVPLSDTPGVGGEPVNRTGTAVVIGSAVVPKVRNSVTCVLCPQSCVLQVSISNSDGSYETRDGSYEMKGNKCPRGREYAVRELTQPTRTLTTTVATVFDDYPRLPVRTAGDIPLDSIRSAMGVINGIRAERRLKPGDVLVENLLGTGVALIATADMTGWRKEA